MGTFERMVIEADRQGAIFEIHRDGQPVAVMLGYDDWLAMIGEVGADD